jgi:hypothetical protein
MARGQSPTVLRETFEMAAGLPKCAGAPRGQGDKAKKDHELLENSTFPGRRLDESKSRALGSPQHPR